MPSDDLDAFFARCDDVLDNWHGSADSMYADYSGKNSTRQADQIQRYVAQMTLYMESLNRLTQATNQIVVAAGEAFGPLVKATVRAYNLCGEGCPTDPRERALWLRQHRNTGPDDNRGTDGIRRRR